MVRNSINHHIIGIMCDAPEVSDAEYDRDARIDRMENSTGIYHL